MHVRNKYSSLGVGTRIRQEREALGLTQTEVGAAAGVTKGAVSAWENGNTKNLRLENLFAIADKLCVSARWLAIGDGLRDAATDSNSKTRRQPTKLAPN